MSYEQDQIRVARNRRLRRRILQVVDATKAAGGVLAVTLRDAMGAQEFDDDQHLMSLAIDLRNAGLIEIVDMRSRVGQAGGIAWSLLKITDSGTSLLEEGLAPHPLVADERR